jgi:DNA-cytosine methyltransferase
MKVLSLFDGMSCGRIALDQLGIPVEKYYASEIDKYAIQVSQANYPDIIQVGDVCDLDPKDYMDVDLIQAGSPCQGFSFAGKQLAFDDPRSALFFEFIRLLKAIKPKYFLLENVRMKKEFLDVITEQVSECYEANDVAPEFKDLYGNVTFKPHFINASLVSAQSRQRYYWTNIPGIKQPEDRGIVLRDILETEPDNFTKMSDKFVKRNGDKNCMIDQDKEKAHNLSAMEYVKNGRQGNYLACDDEGKPVHKPVKDTPRNRRHVRGPDEKSLCMTATMYKGAGNNGMTLVPHKPIKVGMNVEEVKIRKHKVDEKALQKLLRSAKKESKKTIKDIAKECNVPLTKAEHWFRTDSNFAIPKDTVWIKLKFVLGITTNKFDKALLEFEYRDGVYESTQRVYSDEGKSPTLTASNKEQMIETKPKKAYDIPREILKDNERQRRVYDPSGKSPTILGRSDSPKVTTPKQVGVAVDIKGHDQIKRVYSPEGKSPTVTTCQGGNTEPKVMVSNKRHKIIEKNLGDRITDETLLIGSSQKNAYLGKDKSSSLTEAMGKGGGHVPMVRGGAFRGRAYDKDGKRMDKNGVSVANKTKQMLELRQDSKSNAITTVGKDSVVVEKSHPIKANYYKSSRANFENDTKKGGKFSATGVKQEDLTWRKLTPLECERLQTVPDNYTDHVSNTQRYKMLGNGWCVEVIKHIFKNMEINENR